MILSRKYAFFCKKAAQRASAWAQMCMRVYAGVFENFLDGDGGVQAAGVGRWHGNYGNCEIYERGMGAPVFALMGYAAASLGIPRGGAVPLCGMARGADLPQGYAGNDGNGGVQVAAAWHNKNGNERKRTETNGEWCVTIYPEGLQGAVGFGSGKELPHGNAMGRFTAGVMQWADLPQG